MHSLTIRADRYPRPFPWHTVKTVAECLAVFLGAVILAYIGMVI